MLRACVKPCIVTLNTLMDGYYLVNEVENVKYVFNVMTQMGVTPNIYSYNIMINGLCKRVNEVMNLCRKPKNGVAFKV